MAYRISVTTFEMFARWKKKTSQHNFPESGRWHLKVCHSIRKHDSDENRLKMKWDKIENDIPQERLYDFQLMVNGEWEKKKSLKNKITTKNDKVKKIGNNVKNANQSTSIPNGDKAGCARSLLFQDIMRTKCRFKKYKRN